MLYSGASPSSYRMVSGNTITIQSSIWKTWMKITTDDDVFINIAVPLVFVAGSVGV